MESLGIFHLVRYVSGSDPQLAGFYQRARALVVPSSYEGFCIPLVEAMGLGCPVICSDRGPMPEVVEDAGAYFNPGDIDHMQHVLEKVLFDDSLLEDLSGRGPRRASLFSWDRTARETLDVYRTLL